MKKLQFIFALAAILLIATSGYNDKQEAATIGSNAPDFITKNSTSVFRVSEHRGKYILLSFWSSDDAESRRMCKMYDSFVHNSETPILDFVGVNFDTRSELFEQIVLRDRLNASRQYRVSGKVADHICKSYGLDGRLGTLLIDPSGNIIATNPDDATLHKLVKA